LKNPETLNAEGLRSKVFTTKTGKTMGGKHYTGRLINTSLPMQSTSARLFTRGKPTMPSIRRSCRRSSSNKSVRFYGQIESTPIGTKPNAAQC
jgi:hypothetical protein